MGAYGSMEIARMTFRCLLTDKLRDAGGNTVDDKSYSEDTVTIDGEEIKVDVVRDPRAVKMGVWHARGVYRKQYVMAQGDSVKAAYENWGAKARELIGAPEPTDGERSDGDE